MWGGGPAKNPERWGGNGVLSLAKKCFQKAFRKNNLSAKTPGKNQNDALKAGR